MMVAHEFGDISLQKVADLGPEMVGWWLAFFKYKNELENTPTKKRSGPTSGGKAKPKRPSQRKRATT